MPSTASDQLQGQDAALRQHHQRSFPCGIGQHNWTGRAVLEAVPADTAGIAGSFLG